MYKRRRSGHLQCTSNPPAAILSRSDRATFAGVLWPVSDRATSPDRQVSLALRLTMPSQRQPGDCNITAQCRLSLRERTHFRGAKGDTHRPAASGNTTVCSRTIGLTIPAQVEIFRHGFAAGTTFPFRMRRLFLSGQRNVLSALAHQSRTSAIPRANSRVLPLRAAPHSVSARNTPRAYSSRRFSSTETSRTEMWIAVFILQL